MITSQVLKSINRKYFVVISSDLYSITLLSKCTNHAWKIQEAARRDWGKCFFIFHTHNYLQPFHLHAQVKSFDEAINQIQSHDAFQVNGRVRMNKTQKAEFLKQYA